MKVRDPVCGMCMDWEEAHAFEVWVEGVVYFCCAGCAERFADAPERFLSSPATELDADGSCGRHDLVRRHGAPHGVPSTVPLAARPRVGRLTVDDFEKRVYREWIALTGEPDTGCRVLERAALSMILNTSEPHRLQVRIAAEVSRLREQSYELDACHRRLAALPAALAGACRAAGLTRNATEQLTVSMADQVESIRDWLCRSVA